MSHHRGWHSRRRDRQYQDDRYYDHTGSQYYGHGNSYTAQPYAPAPDPYYSADTQHSYGYNYNYNYNWRGDPHYAPHPYESPMDYGRSHRYADDDYPAEHSHSYRQRQRSNSPYRQYHTRADRPHLTPPSFRWRTPDTTQQSPAPQTTSPVHPPPPPPPVEPDSAYMTLSSEPSRILDDPRAARKLLILDLNGTLLIRSQHNPRARKVTDGRNNIPQTPRLRAVQPRPYMPTFCAYLFAPETQEWLDTMVWSSAQPHSVADMVGKVFGDSKSKLIAVWDRESLGLSREEYSRKTQTTKDLTKPWALLPLGTSPADLVVQSEVDSAVEKTGLTPSVAHSAMTTLLLDDSPAKARLQPYNHVCIPEYDSSLRATDLESYEREKMKAKSIAAHIDNEFLEKGSQVQVHTPTLPVAELSISADIPSPSSDSDLSVVESTPSRVEPILPSERARISPRPVQTYDPTLLAVIGILDEIKKQSSVAGWIRGGGLWDIVAAATGEMTSGPDASAIEELVPPTGRAAKRLAKKERKRAGQIARNATMASVSPHKEVIQTGSDESGADNARMWFSDDDAFGYWVWKGYSALERLGIEVVHGVTK